jgi:hypothetical protein
MLVTVRSGTDFSAGCAGEGINHSLFATHPPRLSIREWLYASIVPLGILAAANLYSPLRYLVPGNQPRAGQGAIPRHYRTGAMQDAGYELRRIHLLRLSDKSLGCPLAPTLVARMAAKRRFWLRSERFWESTVRLFWNYQTVSPGCEYPGEWLWATPRTGLTLLPGEPKVLCK